MSLPARRRRCEQSIREISGPSLRPRRIAIRTDFLDHPRDYKKHSQSTPYLGGAGVIAAFLIVAAILGQAFSEFASVMVRRFRSNIE